MFCRHRFRWHVHPTERVHLEVALTWAHLEKAHFWWVELCCARLRRCGKLPFLNHRVLKAIPHSPHANSKQHHMHKKGSAELRTALGVAAHPLANRSRNRQSSAWNVEWANPGILSFDAKSTSGIYLPFLVSRRSAGLMSR